MNVETFDEDLGLVDERAPLRGGQRRLGCERAELGHRADGAETVSSLELDLRCLRHDGAS